MSLLNETHDPQARSWIDIPEEHPFSLQNLPYCIFSDAMGIKRVGVAIGDYIIDLARLYESGYLGNLGINNNSIFITPSLNQLMQKGRAFQTKLRQQLFGLLEKSQKRLKDDIPVKQGAFFSQSAVKLHIPVHTRAFVDFYSNENHASNVGKMFRDPENPLLPNWKQIPIAYNGRASSIVLSGDPISRPVGQIKSSDSAYPELKPTQELDFELELGFFTCKNNPLGSRVAIEEAEDFIFGFVIVNDWSARDIQRWEYQPLGPFLAKSFATSISPWVVTIDALEPWRSSGPDQNPEPLPYLRSCDAATFDIEMEVRIKTEKAKKSQMLSKTNYKTQYWNMVQQIAHQTVNGTNIEVGDLYASGTISGTDSYSCGSMLELAWKGEKPITIAETQEKRAYIQDGDTIEMKAECKGIGYTVGFGEVKNKVLPAAE